MRAPTVGIVDYGAGNLRSVEFALEELGVPHRRVSTPEELARPDRIVLPGVGAAASAMAGLRERGLVEALRELERPLLGICLGMQILVESSDEGEETVECLGLLPGRTRRFRAGLPLPQMGWNRARDAAGSGARPDPLFAGLPDPAWFYFLHAHRVECDESLWVAGAEYGEPFPAAVRRGRVAGVQFHPEKSAAAGLRLLANFCRP